LWFFSLISPENYKVASFVNTELKVPLNNADTFRDENGVLVMIALFFRDTLWNLILINLFYEEHSKTKL